MDTGHEISGQSGQGPPDVQTYSFRERTLFRLRERGKGRKRKKDVKGGKKKEEEEKLGGFREKKRGEGRRWRRKEEEKSLQDKSSPRGCSW